AISDITEACGHARAQAVLSGVPSALRFRLEDRTMDIISVNPPSQDQTNSSSQVEAEPPATPPAKAIVSPFKAQLSDQLAIEMLDVNFQEKKDDEVAQVRFFPNGTSDEFTIVLQWPDYQMYRKITLDIITGQPDVEVIR
ncbi:MAG: hypothetical protein M1608_13330, partial [Candidatus Omnitrophica bacterium]|nr:hypothetical protein [Candidatus Omnitrophota bacterium]